uniref:HAUS augmin like complex subunit 6 n=1 Tax=Leptobrachium leishanense TaxID=445787 RepID=A0A8C5LXP5_9ANUR
MLSGPRQQPIWHKEYLWLALQALGFDPGSEAALSGKNLLHVTFGVNMFDKPNKDAFDVVFHFLFAKLDATRCKEAFRNCWPLLNKKRDVDFRKTCCDWLKKISEDAGSGFPQVVPSLFLSPGGPKFVHLLYHFVRYVMLQHIRKDADDASSYIAEALQVRIQDPQKALERNNLARQRYLRMLQRENSMIMEYQRKAQINENVKLDSKSRDKKIEEIRGMWKTIMETLKTVEKEVEVVDSVVKGNVDQFCLDGSKITLNIPNTLVTRIETEMHTLQMENVYEAGKVNLITVIQLLNEALKIVKQERHIHNSSSVPLDLHYLAGKAKFETDILTRLINIRNKIKREDLVAIDKIISDSEKDWEKKWKRFLGRSPFGIHKILELQPTKTSDSFDTASEEFRNLIDQYALCVTDELSNDAQTEDINRDAGTLQKYLIDVTGYTPRGRNAHSLFGPTPEPKRRLSLNEQDFRTPSPFTKEGFIQKNLSSAVNKRLSDNRWKSGSSSLAITRTQSTSDPISAARQQLAQQVADLIASESPRASGGRGGELEDLIGILSSDPFLSKKEIPRTPENLLSEIRTSWRNAIQSDSSDVESRALEVPCLDSPAAPESAHCSQIDLSMACFMSTSHVSEHNDSLDTRLLPSIGTPADIQSASTTQSTNKSCSTDEVGLVLPLKGMASETLTPPVQHNTSAFVDQSLCSLLGKSLSLAPTHDNPSAHTTVSWDSSKMVDYDSLDNSGVIQFGILHETLPERLGNISLNSTNSGETSDLLENKLDDDYLFGKPESDLRSTDRKMDIHSIRSRYEALKTTVFTSLARSGKSDRHTPITLSKQKSESSPSLDSGNVFSPLERGLSLDFECLMTPPNDRKLSLPHLISFSPAENVHGKNESFNDVFESQAVTNLNKTFEFAPDPHKGTDEGMGQLIKLK